MNYQDQSKTKQTKLNRLFFELIFSAITKIKKFKLQSRKEVWTVNLTFGRFFLKMASTKMIVHVNLTDFRPRIYLGTRVWTGEEWKDLVRQKHIGRSWIFDINFLEFWQHKIYLSVSLLRICDHVTEDSIVSQR